MLVNDSRRSPSYFYLIARYWPGQYYSIFYYFSQISGPLQSISQIEEKLQVNSAIVKITTWGYHNLAKSTKHKQHAHAAHSKTMPSKTAVLGVDTTGPRTQVAAVSSRTGRV